MIECIFTVDYEVYGNGAGCLRNLVYEPTEALRRTFKDNNARAVFFVEAAELEIMERFGTDSYCGKVRDQIRTLHEEGFEIGLHIHPQWYGARREGNEWRLDASEYNLCMLPRQRITEIVDRAICYLRYALGEASFTPLSFRAGNWLLQPTAVAAEVLIERGIRLDSSVFKGGLQHHYGLDYRPAQSNGPYWRFSTDVNVEDPKGPLLEIPIHSRMVPFWKMLTPRRVALQGRGGSGLPETSMRISRLRDYLRPLYPLKLDFCRMTTPEFEMSVNLAKKDRLHTSSRVVPLVAIGHTKDLVDPDAVGSLLKTLGQKGLTITRFNEVYTRCTSA